MSLTDIWPVRGIELRHGGLELRRMTEADLPGIVDRLPDDLEMDPTLPRYAALDPGAARAAALVQGYWRSMGGWSPQDWALPFLVRVDDDVVGAQVLEGPSDYREHRLERDPGGRRAGVEQFTVSGAAPALPWFGLGDERD